MKIIVQKFGGTSVASEEARVAVKNKVQQAIRNGYSPVVVVSAMGRKGAPYATDTLIGTLKDVNLSVNVREMDMMMCCGEIISACVMAATLQNSVSTLWRSPAVRQASSLIPSLVPHASKHQYLRSYPSAGGRHHSGCLRLPGYDGKQL